MDLGEPQHAIELYEQALKIYCELGYRHGEGCALGNLGLAHADLGQYHEAIKFYEQQLMVTRKVGDRRGEGNALKDMERLVLASGKLVALSSY